jgi:uncharacterized damage-inducible protein DinB
MTTPTTADLRYPIGRYAPTDAPTEADRARWMGEVAALPDALRAAVSGLDPARMATPYRPDGWTVRQLVHHVADSHMNAYTRFKLALTEDEPTIKPYDEARWALLPDVDAVDPGVSLLLLDALHARWSALLAALPPEAWARTLRHPAEGRTMRLDYTLGLYAWHGRHHTAHVTRLREREGW